MPQPLKAFDRQTLKTIAAQIDAALAPIAAHYGISAKVAGGTFSALEWTCKIKAKITDAETAGAAERRAFDRDCQWFGLKPEHYRARVTLRDGEYYVVGFNLNAHRMPIKIVRVSDGRPMKTTKDALKKIPGYDATAGVITLTPAEVLNK
jgi:hypothetical protein